MRLLPFAFVIAVVFVIMAVIVARRNSADYNCDMIVERAAADLERSDALLSDLDQLTKEERCKLYADRVAILQRRDQCAMRPVVGKPHPPPQWEVSGNDMFNLVVEQQLRSECSAN